MGGGVQGAKPPKKKNLSLSFAERKGRLNKGLSWSLRHLEGEEALRRNRNPADCKEEKAYTEEVCAVRDVG